MNVYFKKEHFSSWHIIRANELVSSCEVGVSLGGEVQESKTSALLDVDDAVSAVVLLTTSTCSFTCRHCLSKMRWKASAASI